MSKQTRFLDGPSFLLSILLCGSVSVVQAAPATVLAPVVDVKGPVMWAGPGAAKSTPLRRGAALPEGSVVSTGADGRVMLSPVPGIAVSVAKSTSVSVAHLTVVKIGDSIRERQAALKLESGSLSFSIEKGNSSKTTFTVITRQGTMSAQHSVGTISASGSSVMIAALSGTVSFTAKGSKTAIAIEPGACLTASGDGLNAQICVINAVSGTTVDYSADGTPLGTHRATARELASVRGLFAAALAHAVLAVSDRLLSSAEVAGLMTILTEINQTFAAAGLASIETTTSGAPAPASSNSAEVATAPPSFTGGSANPANTSGAIISRER